MKAYLDACFSGKGPIISVLSVRPSITSLFQRSGQRVFLKFCMNLDTYKVRNVTRPEFWKKIWLGTRSPFSLILGIKINIFINLSKTALTIFLKFYMNLRLIGNFKLSRVLFLGKISLSPRTPFYLILSTKINFS